MWLGVFLYLKVVEYRTGDVRWGKCPGEMVWEDRPSVGVQELGNVAVVSCVWCYLHWDSRK